MSGLPDLRSVTPEEFRAILGHLPTSVVVVTAVDEHGPIGMTVGTFTSVSLDPMLVGFLPADNSASWARIRAVGSFCANVLSADQVSLCQAFAARTKDKFSGVDWRASESGSPILPDVVAWIDCDIQSVCPAGDHVLVLGAIREIGVEPGASPLIFHRGAFGRVHYAAAAAS
ncbi:flavin reductase family protein [Nocardia exalbida]|uniref:flavin reductase family protein n=1 Tax=Nocardia exalbida TaxID=290231 RepID=UPI000314D6C9|nr:flavin reductase family protein [Nocardia exalbida]